jgi:hypothetical protein
VAELVESWTWDAPDVVFTACSPHRIAFMVAHLRDFYAADFAEQLIALLPDWVAWLAEQIETPEHLVERCRPYLLEREYPGLNGNDGPRSMARLTE